MYLIVATGMKDGQTFTQGTHQIRSEAIRHFEFIVGRRSSHLIEFIDGEEHDSFAPGTYSLTNGDEIVRQVTIEP